MSLQDGVRSGRYAAVDGQSTVRNWSINLTSESKQFRASNTRGGTGRRRGVKDWTGSFGAYGATPLLLPGEFFTFKGYTAPDDGIEGGVGPTYTGEAIIDSLAITWNWQSGDILSYVANFSGDGEVVESSEFVEDTSEPDVPDFDLGRILIDPNDDDSVGSVSGAGSEFGNWCNLLTATLTLSAQNTAAANSCSGGWRTRTAGPLDWTLAITVQETSMSRLPFDIGDDVPLRLYTGEADEASWRLRWGHVESITGITANTETGDFIQATINIGMNGFVGGERGVIIAPGGNQLWPAA